MRKIFLLLAVTFLLGGQASYNTTTPEIPIPYATNPTGHRLNVNPGAAAANVIFVASAVSSSSSGSLSCSVPAGTQNGDFMLMYVVNNSTTSFSVNNAWNPLKTTSSGVLTSLAQFKIANSEPANYTFTGLGTKSECLVRTYRNVAVATPFDDALVACSGGVAVTAQATAALTATVNPNEMNVNYWAAGTGQAITGPGGLSNVQSDATQLGVYSGDSLIVAAGNVAAAKTATVAAATQMCALSINLLGTSSPVPASFAFTVSAPTAGQTIAGTAAPYTGGAGTAWGSGVNLYYVSTGGLVKLVPSNILQSSGAYSGSFDSTMLPNGPVSLKAAAFRTDGTPSAPIPINVVVVNNSAVTFVGANYAGSNVGSGATCSVKVPTGTAAGDVMVAYAATQGTAPGPTPGAWTLAATAANTIQSATAYWKVAASGDLGATINFTGLQFPECAIRDYHGVYTGGASPVDSTTTCVQAAATSCTATGLAPTASSSEVQVGFWDYNPNSAPTCPAAFGNITSVSDQRGFCMGDLVLGQQGATPGPQTATGAGGASYWDSVNLTLLGGPPVATAPSITTPPANQQVAAGAPATFSVVAAGTPPLSYQWHYIPAAGGDSVVGTNAASYTTGAQQLSNTNDGYYVIVSNSSGSAKSVTAKLTVTNVTSSTFDKYGLPNPPPSPNNQKAVPALAFNSSVGINVCGGPSCCSACVISAGSIAADEAMTDFIGVKYIRPNDYQPIGSGDMNYMISWAQHGGMKIDWHIDNYNDFSGPCCATYVTTAELTSQLLPRAKQLANAGVLGFIEGLNEPDNFTVVYNGVSCGGGNANKFNWQSCAQMATDFYAILKADPVTKNYAFTSPTNVAVQYANYGMQYVTPAGIPAGAGTVVFGTGTVFEDIGASHPYQNGKASGQANVQWYSASATLINNPGGNTYISYCKDFCTGGGFIQGGGGQNTCCYPGMTQAQAADVINNVRVTTEWNVPETGAVPTDDLSGIHQMNSYIDYFIQGNKVNMLFAICAPPTGGGAQGIPGQGVYPDNCAGGNPLGGFPGANFMHSMTRFLADTGDVTSPGTVPWTFASGCPSDPYASAGGGDSECHGLLLQKSSSAAWNPGSYDLVMTFEPATGWGPINLNLSLVQQFSRVNVYDLTTVVSPSQNTVVSPTPIASCNNCTSISINWSTLGHSGGFPPPLVAELIP